MVEVGMDLWNSSGSNPSAQAESLRAAWPGSCPDGLWMKGWRLHIYLGNLCQCLVIHRVKKCFLMYSQKLLCFSLCPLPLVLPLGTNEKGQDPLTLHPAFRYLHILIRAHLILLSSGLSSPSSQGLASQVLSKGEGSPPLTWGQYLV